MDMGEGGGAGPYVAQERGIIDGIAGRRDLLEGPRAWTAMHGAKDGGGGGGGEMGKLVPMAYWRRRMDRREVLGTCRNGPQYQNVGA